MPAPSAFEQMMLELANRVRLDPGGEFDRIVSDARSGAAHDPDTALAIRHFGVNLALLEDELRTLAPVQPLAWNDDLAEAAAGHSALMRDQDAQSHQLPGEPALGARLTAAGYVYSVGGENVFAYTRSPAHGHDGFIVDWGAGPDGMQTPRGHRNNLMSAAYREMGVSALSETSSATAVGPWVVTQNLGARTATGPFLLGVAYDDRDGDDFYSIGEGRSGLTVSVEGRGSRSTGSAGGYAVEAGEGVARVTLSGGPAAETVVADVRLERDNVKLDLVDGRRLLTSADLDLVRGASAVVALGVRDVAISGAGGAEELTGNSGNNRIDGGGGNDRIDGGAGSDRLTGGTGGDLLYGGSGKDHLVGGSNDDVLWGGTYGDLLYGGSGDDEMHGGTSGDRLYGGSGNDGLRGDTGSDRLWGGSGGDELRGDSGGDLLYGGSGKDHLAGGSDDDVLWGGTYGDLLYGGSGDDEMHGGTSGDRLYGGSGNDGLRGDTGSDRLSGGSGDDWLRGASEADLVWGGGGNDYASGGSEDDSVWGGTGRDRVYGGSGNDRLYGDSAADAIYGGSGGDRLWGGTGGDVLKGGSGADRLEGGAQGDALYGGGGADVFVFGPNEGRDVIHDFETVDRIMFTGGVEAEDVSMTSDGADAVLRFAGTTVVVVGEAGLVLDDLIA